MKGQLDTAEDFGRALALYRVRDLHGAAAFCTEILRVEPDHLDALRLHGTVLADLKQPERALACFERALALQPDNVELLYNRANALQAANRHEEAVDQYDRVLGLRADFPEALNNRGTSLRLLARHEAAVASYDAAIALRPGYARAWGNRGVALRELKRTLDSIASFRTALRLEPGNPLTLTNLSTALRDHGLHDEALACAERAVALRPAFAEALVNRGAARQALDQAADALSDYDAALEAATTPAVRARAQQGRYEALMKLQDFVGAAEALGAALAIDPDIAYGPGNLFHAHAQACDWARHDTEREHLLRSVRQGARAARPFEFLAVTDSAGLQRECARAFGADLAGADPRPLWTGENYGHDRIRVAYVSPDFREHAVAYLLAGVIERHDRSRFETVGIALRSDPRSAMTRRLKDAFEVYVDASGLRDAQVAAILREREIDIVVNLMGYTDKVSTIFARRAAPIQVNFLGYTGTLATDYHDYLIADEIVVPPALRHHYAEQIAYLPHCYQPADDAREIAAHTPGREECGLPPMAFVYCAFNRHFKITPDIFDCWMRILRAVDHSVLWLSAGAEAARANLATRARRHGVDPARLIYATHTASQGDHLARHRLADLFLDTLPFNAHTTASDALWSGLPVLTCAGEAFASRVAASLLHAVGLPELVTSQIADYELAAVDLARDPSRLAALKARLRDNRHTHPLFRTERYTRHLEAAYAEMHARQGSRGPLQPIFVQAAPDERSR